MSDTQNETSFDASRLILDAAGKPIGEYPLNRDPEAVSRMHPVPTIGADGKPVLDGNGDPITELVPINYQRAQDQITSEGLRADSDNPHVLVAAEKPAKSKS